MGRRGRGEAAPAQLNVAVLVENRFNITSAVQDSLNAHIIAFSHVENYIVLERN